MQIIINSLEEMKDFGVKLGKALKAKDIVCLDGDLGAGKTTLTQSIGLGLGVKEYITSPTFALLNEYKGDLDVYHFDVYRLENIDEIYELGFEDYFYSDGVSIIEWADMIKEILPDEIIEIYIQKDETLTKRIITINAYKPRYEELLKEMNL